MKLFKKITVLLLLAPFILAANTVKKHEKSKTISRSFKVNSNATVYIKNKYGNVNVTTWDKNQVEIDVKITVKGKDVDKVAQKLNAIKIEFESTSSLVEARTIIESVRSGWSWWGSKNNLNYQINYFVKMPVTNNADLNNKYGNIELDILEGKANINCDYGSIEVEKLLNASNAISLDYCGNSEIRYMKSGTISADYSKITVDKAENLKVNADYTAVKLGEMGDLNFNCDYGSIAVNDVVNAIGNSDYAGMRFGTIRKNLKVGTDYGGLRIKNLAKGFESVSIDSNYAGVKIGTSSDNSFSFTVNLSYASFNYPSDYIEMFKSIKKTTSKYYEGNFGKGNSDSKISIRSDYGGVSLKLND
ncbi:hypothetical protein [Tenacibaculum amylolyticum]|uniref:hypothetical protein n=1 Tax=Tenacibaculum amylolyticum TaxID=104269 RepID=UPI003892D885